MCIGDSDVEGCAGAWLGVGVRELDAYKDRMDCFRSGRDGAEEVDIEAAALDGLAGTFACVPPKKSKPSSESPPVLGWRAVGGAALDTVACG